MDFNIQDLVLSLCLSCGLWLQYEDDEGDKVLLATDSDLVAAVNYARLAGLKVNWIYFYPVQNCTLASK